MRFLRSLAILVAALAFLVFVGGQAFIPSFVEQRLTAGIRAAAPEADVVAVQVAGFPAYRMLGGHFRSVRVDVARLRLADLWVDRLSLDGRNVQVRMADLLQGTLTIEAADAFHGEIVISEAALLESLQARLPQVPAHAVRLRPPDRAEIQGRLSVLGRSIDLVLGGRFVVQGESVIAFVPEGFAIEQQAVPAPLVEAVTREWHLQIDLADGPLPFHVEGITIDDGRLVVRARRPGDAMP